MEPISQKPEDEFYAAFRRLARHEPRPGYEKRFWARAAESQSLPFYGRWLPVMATALGLMLGLVLADRTLFSQRPNPILGAMSPLPAGSLTTAFAFKEGE